VQVRADLVHVMLVGLIYVLSFRTESQGIRSLSRHRSRFSPLPLCPAARFALAGCRNGAGRLQKGEVGSAGWPGGGSISRVLVEPAGEPCSGRSLSGTTSLRFSTTWISSSFL